MALKNPLIKARLSNFGCRKGFEIVANGGKFKIRCMTDVSSAAAAATAAAAARVLDQGRWFWGVGGWLKWQGYGALIQMTSSQCYKSYTGLHLQVSKYRAIFKLTCSHNYC